MVDVSIALALVVLADPSGGGVQADGNSDLGDFIAGLERDAVDRCYETARTLDRTVPVATAGSSASQTGGAKGDGGAFKAPCDLIVHCEPLILDPADPRFRQECLDVLV